jgi:hypothetical protein
MTRESENGVDGFQNPVLQAERHEIQLKNWLKNRKLHKLPIETIAIMSKTTTIMDTTNGNPEDYKKLIYAESFLKKLKEVENKYQPSLISKNKLHQLTHHLLNGHIPHFLNIYETYGISHTELLKGVQCPNCKKIHKKYISGNWVCSFCKYKTKTAFIEALKDYALLINHVITRNQLKEFLQITSQQAKNHLITMNLPIIGSKRSTKYILSPLLENHKEKGEI